MNRSIARSARTISGASKSSIHRLDTTKVSANHRPGDLDRYVARSRNSQTSQDRCAINPSGLDVSDEPGCDQLIPAGGLRKTHSSTICDRTWTAAQRTAVNRTATRCPPMPFSSASKSRGLPGFPGLIAFQQTHCRRFRATMKCGHAV